MTNSPAAHVQDHLRVYDELPAPEECRRIRERAGVPRKAVADDCGVTRDAIASWESGRRRPTRPFVDRYLAALAVMREAASA